MGCKITEYDENVFTTGIPGVLSFIDNWYDLGVVLGVPTRILSYALKSRDELQTKLHIKDRVVYKSLRSLNYVQKRLLILFNSLYAQIPTEHMLAYIKNKNPRDYLAEHCTGYKYEVTFDIRKYYDNISLATLVETLKDYGCTTRGAKLIARYCVVRRLLHGNKQISTLQQGSAVSPNLSNLVGYKYLDAPLLEWLEQKKREYPELEYKYVRFSDNVALFLRGEVPLDFIKDYRTVVQEVTTAGKFKTHKHRVTPANHPKQNQQFLGIVLNKIARIDKYRYDCLRSTLFNSVVHRQHWDISRYFIDNPVPVKYDTPAHTAGYLTIASRELYPGSTVGQGMYTKYMSILGGHCAYVTSVSAKQGKCVTKLHKACALITDFLTTTHQKLMNGHTASYTTLVPGRSITVRDFRAFIYPGDIKVSPALFTALKLYRVNTESIDDYLHRLLLVLEMSFRKCVTTDPASGRLRALGTPPPLRRNDHTLDQLLAYWEEKKDDTPFIMLEKKEPEIEISENSD